MGRFDPALLICRKKEAKMNIDDWTYSCLEKINDDCLVKKKKKTF